MVINKNLMDVNITPCKRDKSDIDFIVIHYVGALGDAKANTDYYKSTYVGASADFWVGFKGDIWQGNDYYNNYSWHCGGGYQSNWTKDGAGEFYGICKNSNSIGIEMCVRKKNTATMNATDTDWYFEDATVKATAELTAHLMKELDIGIDHVIRHYSVNKKICPNPMVIDYQKWLDFKDLVMKYYDGSSYEEADKVLYRVRKSWSDASSQIGAFKILENAKANCPEGYSVFDENGKAVYAPKGKDITELTGKDLSGTEAEKIAKVAPIYQKVMKETGMLASVGLAQFALESGFGTTDLALKANNFHGMKCSLSGNTWDGSVWDGTSKYGKYSPEVYNGVTTNVYSEFRAYPSIYKSVQDRAAYFIGAWLDKGKTQHRYPNINKIKDAETQVKLIKANNYATDPNYVSKLLNIIERFNLTQYDKGIQPEVWSKDDTEVKVLPDTAISYYRVAKAYKDGKYDEQLGAYTNKDNAINGCPDGYSVFDPNSKIIYPASVAYLVRCGYSSVYLKALVRRNKVRKAGFDAVIKKMDGKYIIQCGLFKNRENAADLTNKIRKAGFGAVIIETE